MDQHQKGGKCLESRQALTWSVIYQTIAKSPASSAELKHMYRLSRDNIFSLIRRLSPIIPHITIENKISHQGTLSPCSPNLVRNLDY